MMFVNERAKRVPLIRRAQPVDLIRVDEVLHQPEGGQEKAEDGHEAHDEAQARGAVNEDERGGEVDQKRGQLDEHEEGRVWIERERMHGRSLQPRCVRLPVWQQLNETDDEETGERQLQEVATQTQALRAPSIQS